MVLDREARMIVAEANRIVAAAGLAETFTGHVSLQTDDDTVYIPEHRHDEGFGLDSTRPENVIKVDLAGNLKDDVDAEPPGEYVIHSSILRDRDDIHSVLHSHPPTATGVSSANIPVEPVSFHGIILGGPVHVHDPGPILIEEESQADALSDALGDRNAILLRGHGAVTAGESPAEAVANMYYLEQAARMQVIASLVGNVEPFDSGTGPEDVSWEPLSDEFYAYFRNQYLY